MNKNLEEISVIIKGMGLEPASMEVLMKLLKDANKELEITAFKLDRTEKVKQTTAILLDETITELELKQKAAENALNELRATQAQLIQSEKMASLGELTAGIAHEIQNPLNFVNNFSEVSNELIDEMLEEVEKGNYEEVRAIAHDVRDNLTRINHHGRRADSIVKGMLQHSRTSGGQKQPVDFNALTDEYLKLAYHGIRARNSLFNVTLKTEFGKDVEKVNVVPPDFGRVLLNLFSNAFYAVDERKKLDEDGYEPLVSVATVSEGGKVRLTVRDNGGGIPAKILDKIFQPFFTTKPAGQGTGLGLSLAYDIVKAHGGIIEVDSTGFTGTTFSIVIPRG